MGRLLYLRPMSWLHKSMKVIEMNKSRSRTYNRDVSKRKALRKKRIAEEVYYNGKEYPYYNNLHQYSKNKIHCSCPLCSPKTRNKGRRDRKNYQRA